MRISFSRKTFEVKGIYLDNGQTLLCYMDCPPYYYIVVRFAGLTLRGHDRYMYGYRENWSVKQGHIQTYARNHEQSVLNNDTIPFSVLTYCFAVRSNYADKL